MDAGEFFTFLFGGVGATAIGLYINKLIEDARYQQTRIDRTTTITTPRDETPTVYQPIWRGGGRREAEEPKRQVDEPDILGCVDAIDLDSSFQPVYDVRPTIDLSESISDFESGQFELLD